MDKGFYSQTIKTEYQFKDFIMVCRKLIKYVFKDKVAIFEGIGEAYQEKNDPYDGILGKAFALTRADKDIDNQIENYLIKYSCKPNSQLFNLKDVTLTIDGCTITKDKIDLLFKEPQPQSTTLDKLVGKWAVRTKFVEKPWDMDESWSKNPLFVIGIDEHGIKFNDSHSNYIEHYFYWHDENDKKWLDNNWIEHKKEKTLKEEALNYYEEVK
jgi:hypothetical protein